MIDPTCGSGHFLLGGFARLLEEWRRHAPEMPPAAQAQKALDAVAGVDLNPFAVEIARFRLLVVALKAAGVQRLAAAPDFQFQLATGDSLLHGRHFFRRELGGTEEGFRRVMLHHYVAEDNAAVEAILGRQYHAVVGNPPYITPKDAAMRDAYREIYESCHMKYGLGVPFTERFFDLAQGGTQDQMAGFVGLIVANSFMKREFGKKLIQAVLPRLDLTHSVDCSGAYIPGHGTPTVILFGRNRKPVERVVRTVRGVRGEPAAPEDPAQGIVWSAIVAQTDRGESESAFISTEDTPREALARHPWNMGGGVVSQGIEQATARFRGSGRRPSADGVWTGCSERELIWHPQGAKPPHGWHPHAVSASMAAKRALSEGKSIAVTPLVRAEAASAWFGRSGTKQGERRVSLAKEGAEVQSRPPPITCGNGGPPVSGPPSWGAGPGSTVHHSHAAKPNRPRFRRG